MIDFNRFPKSRELTYTVLKRSYYEELMCALQIAGETDWEIRTCSFSDRSMLDDIREHLPDWFDARCIVFISHFESAYVKQHIDEICKDADVQKMREEERREAYEDYVRNYQWIEKAMEMDREIWKMYLARNGKELTKEQFERVKHVTEAMVLNHKPLTEQAYEEIQCVISGGKTATQFERELREERASADVCREMFY